jgi:hypothetical protein
MPRLANLCQVPSTSTTAPTSILRGRTPLRHAAAPTRTPTRLQTRPAPMSIIAACQSPAFFAPWFKRPATWAAWFSFLKALFGLPMTPADVAIFQNCTGRIAPPKGGVTEAWLPVGRRGGKSLILALIAVYLATFRDWRPYLTPGERGVICIIAADRRQASIILGYIKRMLTRVPALASLVQRDARDALHLTNDISIEVQTASFRTSRGFTIIAALLDEVAFWRSEETSANPDHEILAALRPAMATIPGAMLLAASSPYARRGVLYEAFKKHYAEDKAPALVWRADTLTMNPTIRQSVIAAAYERDPQSAASEYGQHGIVDFRSDIQGYITPEVLDSIVVPGRHELPPLPGMHYIAFTDAAGGSGQDSFTLAVGHRDEAGRAILDLLRERRPPFSPQAVVEEFAEILLGYNCRRVTGDRFAGQFPAETFRAFGVDFALSEKPKSDLYRDFLPLANSGKVELLDHQRMTAQLSGLERRTARGGKDSIDHPPGQHDDIANVVAGVVVAIAGKTGAEIWARLGGQDNFGIARPASVQLFAQERGGF